jgi:hypothetical protein
MVTMPMIKREIVAPSLLGKKKRGIREGSINSKA